MKTRRIWLLAALAALAVVALIAFAAALFIFQSSPLAFQKGTQKGTRLGKNEVILAQARPGDFGVRKGDAFPYVLEVQYDPAQIAGIDGASLDKAVDLKPFEIRDFKETEVDWDARTRVYRREYEIQLIDGKVDQVYEFPTIVVRYRLKNSNGFAEKAVVPDPIFVVSRLPADVSNLELRPITEKVADPSRDRFVWVIWALGGLMVVGGAADLTWRVIPQWREQAKQRRRRRIESGDVLVQAYQSLRENVAKGTEPRRLIYQMDHILRIVLARKEKIGWLEEPNLDSVPSGIRPSVSSLFARCQKAHGMEPVEPTEVEQALGQLDEVLQFYFGTGEVEAWRS